MAAAAVLAGARSITAIAEWAAEAPQPVRAALGARRDAPDHLAVPAEATIRRTLARLDADALAAAVGAWLADRDRERERPRPAASRWRAIAVDGKTLRGGRTQAAGGDGRPVHLLAAMDHTSRAVLAQRQVGGAPEEVPAFTPLLDGLDLAGTVITADALHTHPQAAEFLVSRKRAHDLFQVKANQPTLLARCTGLPWHRVPCWTAPVTAATAASSTAPSRPSPSTTSASPTLPRSSRSPASAPSAARTPAPGVGGGRP
jgi:DDE_Tnp_1-associated/Transposase DDE domain